MPAQSGEARTRSVVQLRSEYHGRWARHLEDPGNVKRMPTVSVVIPLYNRAHLIGQAVASCLDQEYPNVDVIVVDDGSEDCPESVLSGFGNRVRLVRQANQGVSAARNHGLRIARSDFVHFLDSDDYLLPGAIDRKVSAFRDIADAELCTSLYECRGDNGVSSEQTHRQPPLGDAACPTNDFLGTVVQRFPMVNCTVMAPRWVWLDTGFFDEDLRQAEDIRYWFRMALRGTKVVGVAHPLTVIRFTENSLTTAQNENLQFCFRAAMANLGDLMSHAHAWPYLGQFLCSFWDQPLESVFECPREAARWRGEVARMAERLPEVASGNNLSIGPLADVIRRACDRRPALKPLFADALPLICGFARKSPAVTAADAQLWLRSELPERCRGCNRPAMRRVYRGQWHPRSIIRRIVRRSQAA